MANRNIKIIKAYKFMLERESKKLDFTIAELSNATGWKSTTIQTYINKQWKRFVYKHENKYISNGLSNISQDEFIKSNSQKNKYSLKVQNETDILLDKAREFALLATSVYNNPYTEFKTYGYIINMIIAWTALLHAVFQRKNISYFYENNQGNMISVDGMSKTWDLSKCIEHYWVTDKPEKINLKFLIGLRNEIEHRKLPQLEPKIAGHCQSCLNNFERILIDEFGEQYALSSSVTLALQFSRFDEEARNRGLKGLQSAHYITVLEYMDNFENSLSDKMLQSSAYRLSVFLSQKSSNHKTSSDVVIEFVKPDSEESARILMIMKDREKNKYKPKQIIEMMMKEGFKGFSMHHHTQLWKKKKAKNNSQYGTTLCDGQWYWYDDWVKEVQDYCKENKF